METQKPIDCKNEKCGGVATFDAIQHFKVLGYYRKQYTCQKCRSTYYGPKEFYEGNSAKSS